jgi:hypothetical protein
MSTSHPSDADLLIFYEGRLAWLRRVGVARHLARCGVCRARGETLEAALSSFLFAPQRADGRDVLGMRTELLAKMSKFTDASKGKQAAWLLHSRGIHRVASACMALLIVAAGVLTFKAVEIGSVNLWRMTQTNRDLPIRRLTPGAIRTAQVGELCKTADPDNDRAINPITERQVFQEYGFRSRREKSTPSTI